MKHCEGFSKNYKLSHHPSIPLLDIFPKELKAGTHTDVCASVFTASLFTIVTRQKEPTCPSPGGWITKPGAYRQWNIIQP